MVEIQYPKQVNYGFQGSPTPYEELFICDKCGKAEWFMASNTYYQYMPTCYCSKGRKGGYPRMRKATEQERLAGKAALHGTSS